jgi:uncharacterized membrane-anchored protein
MGVVVAGGACVAILVGMLVSHGLPLWVGEPVRLAVEPVDPRDLFRGDYVILSYPIQRLEAGTDEAAEVKLVGEGWEEAWEEWKDWRGARGEVLYVQLEEGPAAGGKAGLPGVPGVHRAVSVSWEPVDGKVNLRGLVVWMDRRGEEGRLGLMMNYGIDAFFVEEGSGRPIEAAIRERAGSVEAEVMVGPGGAARVRALIVNGQRIGG